MHPMYKVSRDAVPIAHAHGVTGASVKAGNGNGIGNWKRNWKLEMVVKWEMVVKII